MNWKRVVQVVIFILVTIGIGFTIYWVFFRNLFNVGLTNRGNINGPTFPSANENRNVPVTNINVNVAPGNLNISVNAGPTAAGGKTTATELVKTIPGAATTSPDGKDLLYYDPVTGRFYRVLPSGARVPLGGEAFPNADKVTWSPLKDKAILEFPDASKIVYDIRQNRQFTLAPEMENIDFSPSGDRITFKFMGVDEANSVLMVSKFDGSEAQTLEPLSDKASQFDVNWSPSGNVVALFHESTGADGQRVVPIGLMNENFKSFDVPGRGFESTWSPDGQRMLYSIFTKATGYNPQLYLANGTTDNMGSSAVDLGLQTWSNKCVFGTGTDLYCAVPRDLEQGSALFPDVAKNASDDFYRIDLSTGSKKLIARPVDSNGSSSFNAVNLGLSSDGSVLYFFDQKTNTMQKIQLR